MRKLFSCSLTAFGVLAIVVGLSWIYTTVQLSLARARGAYPSAEVGMLARAEKYYSADRDVRILYAGTNSFDGSKPHIWYVIAEVHASARADGSDLGHNGCDAPGSFFLQTKDGSWVYVPEGAFPGFMGFWMEMFGLAGGGQSIPSTDWAANQPTRFCR